MSVENEEVGKAKNRKLNFKFKITTLHFLVFYTPKLKIFFYYLFSISFLYTVLKFLNFNILTLLITLLFFFNNSNRKNKKGV